MPSATDVLLALRRAGFDARVDRERLLIGNGEALQPALAAAVREHRDELIDALLAEEAAAFDAAPRVDAGRAVAMFAALQRWNESLGG